MFITLTGVKNHRDASLNTNSPVWPDGGIENWQFSLKLPKK